MNYAVILAGGAGERFWPASTPARPKQLLPLLSDKSMLRETADRLDGVVSAENRFVMTNASLVDAVTSECPEIPRANVIGEPEGKNTAPAIALMAGLLAARDPRAVLLVMPADHAIGRVDAFRASLEGALQLAAEEPVLAVFGVPPSRPETGYGYVERGEALGGSVEAYDVARFREKPATAEARELWQDGRHYWNAGLFCGQAAVFLEEYAEHLPLIRRSVEAAVATWDDDPHASLQRYYASVEATSIDVGVMQQTDRAVMLPAAEWGWDDVGSWEALARWLPATADGNVAKGNVALTDCRNVIAYARTGRIAALGMENCVIVRTETETMVASRGALDRLRDFVREMVGGRGGGAVTAVRRLAAASLMAAGIVAACGPAFREPPPTDTRPRTQGGPTVVGTVTAEGKVVADTLAGEVPDADAVDRETVVTGAVARAPEEEEPAREAPRPEEEPRDESPESPESPDAVPDAAPGPWFVQVFAAREEPLAIAVARDVEHEIGAFARVVSDAGWYKVRAGGFAERAAADRLRARLSARWADAFLIRVSGS